MAGARVSPILAVTCSGTGAAVPASPQPAFSAAPARRHHEKNLAIPSTTSAASSTASPKSSASIGSRYTSLITVRLQGSGWPSATPSGSRLLSRRTATPMRKVLAMAGLRSELTGKTHHRRTERRSALSSHWRQPTGSTRMACPTKRWYRSKPRQLLFGPSQC
jgi:hypothetical protein